MKRRRKKPKPIPNGDLRTFGQPVPVLTMKAPGLLGFVLPLRPDLGVHNAGTQRSNMVRLLADQGTVVEALPEEARPGPQLDPIPPSERSALLLSLATTVCRAEYHERRFWKITAHLAERRLLVGTPIGFDAYVPSAVFEAAASLAAARTVVDEIVHIAARRNGKSKWDVSTAIKATNLSMKVPEVELLRNTEPWYVALNAYRNVLYHRGWKGDAGAYFPVDAPEPEALDAVRNLLLVPDLASVEDNARAHQWTYREGKHLETVVREALEGMREFVDAVCLGVWGGKLPALGKIPSEEQPTVLVPHPRPIPFLGNGMILLPVFSSESAAGQLAGYPPPGRGRLASLPLLATLFPEPAFALSIAGLELHVTSGNVVKVLIDPQSIHSLQTSRATPVPAELLAKTPFMDPLGLPKAALGVDRLMCWQQDG